MDGALLHLPSVVDFIEVLLLLILAGHQAALCDPPCLLHRGLGRVGPGRGPSGDQDAPLVCGVGPRQCGRYLADGA